MVRTYSYVSIKHYARLLPLSIYVQTLVHDYLIVAGLLSLKHVKKLHIQLDNEAYFGPGVVNAIKEAFTKEGTRDGRSISIRKTCAFAHGSIDKQDSCPGCWNTDDDMVNSSAIWNYKNAMYIDDDDSWVPKLKNRMSGKAQWVTGQPFGRASKASKVKSKAAVTKPVAGTRKLRGRRVSG